MTGLRQERLTRGVLLAIALALHGGLIAFGILRTEVVVNANHLFPFADKVWHALYYAVLAMLLYAVFRDAVVAMLVHLSLAGIDEAIQALTPGRSASWGDFAVDALIGVLVIITFRERLARRAVPGAESRCSPPAPSGE